MNKLSKGSVLYVHSIAKGYDCDDCPAFLPESSRCVLHGRDDKIGSMDSCGYWMGGLPGALGLVPLGLVTKQESGFAENVHGAGCEQCIHFNAEDWQCEVVDETSPGDDPGMIHPDACCAAWKEE